MASTNTPGTTDPQLTELLELDCCAVSDALDACGIDGFVQGLQSLSTPGRIAGRAITIALGADDGRASKRHLGTAAVDAANSGTIIVVANAGRTDVGGWGGILALGAKRQGVRGIVIDGACRDVDEMREMALPVYALATVGRTARGRIIELSWNLPITIAGIPVRAEDLLIADGSGVVVIPADRADEVIAKAKLIVRKEQLMAAAVREGRPMTEVMGSNYEDLLKNEAAS